jgi:hypothetical protein
MFLSNNLMNFDADSGIKRRLIHFEFRNKFVALQDLEKERVNHKIGKVFALDNNLVSKFHNNDDYKNALIHILIKKARQYCEKGLTIPDKYVEMAKEVCEENDKFKNFFDNHFQITNNESDRISKDEFKDMYNSYTKCNFSASSIMTDIQRLQLKYERGLRCVYKGVSLRGVIIGIKKMEEQVTPNEPEAKQSDLDYGLDLTPEPNNDYISKLEKDAKEKNELYNELQIKHTDLNEQFEKMRLEFEAYKKQFPPPTPPAPPAAPKSPPSILIIEDSDEEESEPEPPKPRPKSKKSILKLIEDSDEDEPDPEEVFIRLKDNKIVNILDPKPEEEGVSFLD